MVEQAPGRKAKAFSGFAKKKGRLIDDLTMTAQKRAFDGITVDIGAGGDVAGDEPCVFHMFADFPRDDAIFFEVGSGITGAGNQNTTFGVLVGVDSRATDLILRCGDGFDSRSVPPDNVARVLVPLESLPQTGWLTVEVRPGVRLRAWIGRRLIADVSSTVNTPLWTDSDAGGYYIEGGVSRPRDVMREPHLNPAGSILQIFRNQLVDFS